MIKLLHPFFAGDEILETNTIKIIIGDIVQLLPHGNGHAFAGVLTGDAARFYTGDRSKIIFDTPQNFAHTVFGRISAEHVSAFLAPGAFNKLSLF